MPLGFMGKVLWVNLTSGEIRAETIPEAVYQKYLSGVGLAAYLLGRAIPAGADALGPDNVLGFVSGLLNCTNSLFTGRWMAVAKSPLTGGWGEANCGGTLAPALKHCGYDGIFFQGCSPRPVIFSLVDGQPRLIDAQLYWGLDTVETDQRLRASCPNSAVACIGPAGEKQSLIAGIVNDGGRLAARSGLGAVMGSKGLKAIVLHGLEKVAIANPTAMEKLSQQARYWVRMQIPLPPGKITRYIGTLMRILPVQWAQDGMLYKWLLQRWGTISMNQISVEMGDAPIRNWQGSNETFSLAQSAPTDPDALTDVETKKYHCSACALSCGGIITTESVPEGHKPEYETVMAWGGLLLNNDMESIIVINEMLNRAGMDSISAGATVAFALECAEHGLLASPGLDLRWGNSSAIRKLAEMMITREGIGDVLADGSRKAAERLGVAQTGAFAVHAGGQELAMHDGRNDPGFALHAVVEPMPGRHTNGSQLYYEMFQLWKRIPGLPKPKLLYAKEEKYAATPDQAAAAVACSRFSQVINGAGVCLFGAFMGVTRIPIFEWMNAATGWNLTPQDYMQIGARIQATKQLFNARHGLPLRHTINRRALGIPSQKHGANRGRQVDLDRLVPAYWAASGWDETTGLPTPAILAELEIEPF